MEVGVRSLEYGVWSVVLAREALREWLVTGSWCLAAGHGWSLCVRGAGARSLVATLHRYSVWRAVSE